MRSWGSVVVASLVVCAAQSVEGTARACGGTFCDQAPPGQAPMPVDQTGENVLFVMSAGWVEAHIQIQYQGDPARFAWVIPLPAKPELSVGSQLLFTNLLNGTVPTFQLTSTFEPCQGEDTSTSSSGAGCGASSEDSGSSSLYSPNGSSNTDSDAPKVVGRAAVGNFETVTLEPTSPQGMVDWLVQNGYEPDSGDAAPVIQDYVDRGYVFVAVKLQPGAGVDEIHPLVVRYPGSEPCVPLKLTRIAAVEDMTVRTFFLGDERVVPMGSFKHVTLNPARLDWAGLGQNYNLAVARAVDSPVAGGRAFVTDYAGPIGVTWNVGLYSVSWDASAFASIEPQQAISVLTGQGLLTCTSSQSCQSPHPLVFGLLERYLPTPDGVPASAYYQCPTCYPTADLSQWDAQAFMTDFDQLIVAPGKHAKDLLANHLYLTRMVTRISPSEMTDDPMFRVEKGLPDVSNLLSATRTTRCDGTSYVQEAGGLRVEDPPSGLPADFPWASTVEEFTPAGEHLVLVDNGETIDEQLLFYNVSTNPESSPELPNQLTDRSGACGCSLPGRRASQGIALGLFGLLYLLRRAGKPRD